MTGQHNPDTSVVICAYTEDRWAELVAAVDSMQSQTRPPREIITVIDHNPALFKRVQEQLPGFMAHHPTPAQHAELIVVENRETRGLSGARNTGIALARGSIIAFMDEDARAASDWLERLSAGYQNTHVLGVGGLIEPSWPNGRPGWFPEEFDWVVGCTYRGMPNKAAPVRNLIGCNMSFRRAVFETVGGFHSEIGRVGTRPVGDEETELCIRANQHWPQGIILYEPRARVRHRVHFSRVTWRYFFSRCYAEGLSKAVVSRLVGAQQGLASERTYTFHTLPLGAWRGLVDTLTGRDRAGLARAAAIVAGLAVTTVGYLNGLVVRGSVTQDYVNRERTVPDTQPGT